MAVRKPLYLNADSDLQQFSTSDSVNNSDKLDGFHASQFVRSDTNDTINGDTKWVDNKHITLGTNTGSTIYYDGKFSFFDIYQGTLYIRYYNGTSFENIASFQTNGGTSLYYNNNLMLRTVSDGVSIEGDNLEFKDGNLSHSFTSITKPDTYAKFSIADTANGGLRLDTFTEDGEIISEEHHGHIYTTFSQNLNADAKGLFHFVGHRRSGTGVTDLMSADILATFRNNDDTVFIMRANGAIYNDVNIYGYFDDEDDLILSETLRNKFADGKPVLKHYEERLGKIGIMKNGFVSLSGLSSLNLGSIGQLFNIVKNLASRLGISKDELLKIAKEYH